MATWQERMAWDLGFAQRADKTRKLYVSDALAFARFFERSPEELGQAEVRAWVEHLTVPGTSPSRLRQHLSALVFLFRTMFAAGLRIREACRLQVGDLDAERGVIRVTGKGGRERQAALHPRLLEALRAYWREVRPVPPWLFTGRVGKPLDTDQARKVFKEAVRVSGLAKRATPHALRHTYATLLLEQGTGLAVIQALLGHSTIRSTERYLHVATHLITASTDPLELLPP